MSLDHVAVGVASGLASNAAYQALEPATPAGESVFGELRSLRELMEQVVELLQDEAIAYKAGNVYSHKDVPLNLAAPVELDPPRGYTHVSVWAPGLTNVLLAKDGYADVAVALPANKWTALEMPDGWSIKPAVLGTSVSIVLRYGDERWGSVLP